MSPVRTEAERALTKEDSCRDSLRFGPDRTLELLAKTPSRGRGLPICFQTEASREFGSSGNL